MRYSKKKALMLLIDKSLHEGIKSRAALMGITMTKFILSAVWKELENQNHLGWGKINNETQKEELSSMQE